MEDGETAATFLEKTDIEKLFILSDGRYAVTDMYNRAIRIADEKPELLSSPYYTD